MLKVLTSSTLLFTQKNKQNSTTHSFEATKPTWVITTLKQHSNELDEDDETEKAIVNEAQNENNTVNDNSSSFIDNETPTYDDDNEQSTFSTTSSFSIYSEQFSTLLNNLYSTEEVTLDPILSGTGQQFDKELAETTNKTRTYTTTAIVNTSSIPILFKPNATVYFSTLKPESKTTSTAGILSTKMSVNPSVTPTTTTRVFDLKTEATTKTLQSTAATVSPLMVQIPPPRNICNSSACNSAASRMLGLMNHSADACEDFYDFACGGMDVSFTAEVHETDWLVRWFDENNGYSSKYLEQFGIFYESCVLYDDKFFYNERIAACK